MDITSYGASVNLWFSYLDLLDYPLQRPGENAFGYELNWEDGNNIAIPCTQLYRDL